MDSAVTLHSFVRMHRVFFILDAIEVLRCLVYSNKSITISKATSAVAFDW